MGDVNGGGRGRGSAGFGAGRGGGRGRGGFLGGRAEGGGGGGGESFTNPFAINKKILDARSVADLAAVVVRRSKLTSA